MKAFKSEWISRSGTPRRIPLWEKGPQAQQPLSLPGFCISPKPWYGISSRYLTTMSPCLPFVEEPCVKVKPLRRVLKYVGVVLSAF